MPEVRRSTRQYDVLSLQRDATLARRLQAFGAGAFSHSISLPSPDDVPERFRSHRNNVPFSGALARCPYLRSVFDEIQSPKAAFRLLRRGPHSAYSLHDDRDKGADVARMQIPVVTNARAFLALADDRCAARCPASTDLRRFEDAAGDVWFDLEALDSVFGDSLQLFELQSGYLYFFDTDEVHTLINAGDDERITLAVDVVRTPWLAEWLTSAVAEHVEPVDPCSLDGRLRWQWNSLRLGVLRHPAAAGAAASARR